MVAYPLEPAPPERPHLPGPIPDLAVLIDRRHPVTGRTARRAQHDRGQARTRARVVVIGETGTSDERFPDPTDLQMTTPPATRGSPAPAKPSDERSPFRGARPSSRPCPTFIATHIERVVHTG